MATARRMGPKGSEIWHSMLDAAEVILRDAGYGSLTSRRIAEEIGVKQRLVYYYFQTMEELIVETFRRLAIRDLERMRLALSSNHSLREIWDVCVQTTDTRMVQEFMALANRIEPLRLEVQEYIETSRKMHVEALGEAMRGSGLDKVISPEAAAIFAASAALAVHREAQVGVTTGHADVIAVIDGFIARLDPVE
jgi:AcrR family transcriptional regulator